MMNCTRTALPVISSLFALSFSALAQDSAPGAWRRFGDPPPAQAQDQTAARDEFGQAQNPAPGDPQDRGAMLPAQLIIKAGTYVTVHVNQPLSSDHNQPGDAFSASLARPIVVDGVVVAQTGQTVGGRVAEAQKAGRVSGVSRLGLQLTDLTLVDGQQVPIQSQLITRSGRTSEGQDAAAIAGTTALGAAVGAAADWGRGAAIGAGAGAAAGIIGVLLTRGHATVVYPETVLTFRIEAPVTVSTERSAQAFRYVEPSDYQRASYEGNGPPRRPALAPPPPPYYGPYYGYPYWGSIGVWWGPGFFYGRGYYRGFRRW